MDLNSVNTGTKVGEDTSANALKISNYPTIEMTTFTLLETGTNWDFYFYSEFSPLLLGTDKKLAKEIIEKLTPFLTKKFNDFRIQLTFKSVPFLVGFFYSTNEIRLYTPRLNQELFLLKYENEQDDKFPLLKEYTEKVASLSAKNFPSEIELLTHRHELADLVNDSKYKSVESETQKIVEELLLHLNKYKPTLFEKISDMGLGWTASFALLRIHLLKFLAILPSLDHDIHGVEVKRILIESLRRLIVDSGKARRLGKTGQEKALPRLFVVFFRCCLGIAKMIPAGMLAKIVRYEVRLMARRFIAGETIELAEANFKKVFETGRDVTLDQLGELVVSEKEADHYCDEVIKLIRGFNMYVEKGEKNAAGVNRANVSIKVSALSSDFKPEAFDYTFKSVGPRLKKILLAAKEEDVFLNVDAEHYDYRDVVFKIYRKILLETPELKNYQQTGIVLQAYLRDASEHFDMIINLAKERGHLMPVRIVKGAYWDAETVEADAHAFNAPEYMNKEETDICFRQMIVKYFENKEHVQLVLASHNYSDHAFAEALRVKYYPDAPAVEHQCLHMTYEALSTAMGNMGWSVRNYVPIGSLLVGMAYLVRRIMENSSQVGVLTIMRSHKKKTKLLSPGEVHRLNKDNGTLERDLSQKSMTTDFFNVRPVRLYVDEEREWFNHALEYFRNHTLGSKFENPFNPKGEWETIVSSSDPKIIVGKIKFSTNEDVERAIQTADESYNSGKWAKAHFSKRAAVLIRAAMIMLERRNELSALISYEAGKAIPEALADVDEAIDFLNFYAREEVRLNEIHPSIISRGVVAVVAPWNFPLAIPCGMVSSSLVAGNSVVLKSAKTTPLIAQKLIDILHEAGAPEDVLIHLPGKGSVVGDNLVLNERVAGIVFTGSKAVGMRIAHKASKRIVHNKLFDIKLPTKVITEMGGKNAVIVAANAEIDETVAGILYSAFGHAGQKCSAASRVIVDNSIKDRLIERLREACFDVEVGEAFKYSTALNPLITQDEKDRLKDAVKKASAQAKEYGGKVHVDRSTENFPGYCVGPAMIEIPKEKALDPESYSMKELFGPVLHIIGVNGLDEALKIFNGTEYALTGGIFSQSQDDIDYVTSKMLVGNIYVNRGITGARVAIEPFGGFKLSGTGPKAGGSSYVGSFHVIPALKKPETTPLEEGTEYDVELSMPSKLSPKTRSRRMVKGMEEMVENFEHLFMGVNEREKEVLIKLTKWMREHLENFQTTKHWNKRIPGQLSYNDFSIPRPHTVVVARNERPHLKTLIQFISALAMGSGVNVFCRTQKSYQWWSSILDIFHSAGISKTNFEVFYISHDKLSKILKHPWCSSIIVDGDYGAMKEITDVVFDESYSEHYMKLILSPYDSPEANDFAGNLETFALVRAFAVNTMRHGAPLNLDL